jgi:elongator complex protein 3
LEAAEEVARLKGYARMEVTSGIGVKDYYRRMGYKPQGPYMAKDLD